ncbi:hypothetical protein Ancab_038989 [Ancistrocladus abbreviatus]
MDENEKMTALKKAYAEIILNTAKEAAARIMVSERKAYEFQHDLSATKEEALRLLLRLKQMMDSKISEAETKSVIQQRRIEELEAQLQEAEDIVSNLRAELSETQAEVERLSKNRQQPVDEHTQMANIDYQEETEPRENGPKTSEFTSFIPQGLKPEDLVGSDAKSSTMNQINDINMGCSSNNHLKECCRLGMSIVPSIIMRNKEHELYRNGCTQRIRAFERTLLNGHLSVSGELDDLKNEKINKKDKEGERICMNPTPCTNSMCTVEKNPDEVQEVANADTNGSKARNVKLHRRRRGWIKTYNMRTARKPAPVQVKQALEAADPADSQNCPAVTVSGAFKITSNEASNLPSVLDARRLPDVPEMVAPSRSAPVTISENDKASTVDEDMELVSSLVLISQESGSGNDIGVPSSQENLAVENAPLIDSKSKVSHAGDSVQALKDRPLKYTFQRKRKKGSLSSDDGDARHEDSTLKRRTVKKQNGTLEAPASAMAESSRDSRRMAQVARQLISLSEKKWWQ